MRCHALVAAATAAVMCLIPAASEAEPVVVTSGSVFVGPGPNTVALSGTRGFSLTASLGFGPDCVSALCIVEEGELIQMSALWLGGDVLAARLTLDGVTYTEIGGLSDLDSLSLQFSSPSVRAPDVVQPGPLIVQAPFTLTGLFSHVSVPDQEVFRTEIVGQGVATHTLIGFIDPSAGGFWTSRSLEWTFTDPLAVPEPALLSLVGLGAAGAWTRARRRRTSKR